MASLYERWILPRVIDFAMGQKPFTRQREKVVPRARGRVLEIGMGSGLNLGFYDPGRVESIVGIEPSAELRALSAARAKDTALPVELLDASAEAIPLGDASIDTVVTTYTLCTIPDAPRALAEMRRVLRPGGELLFSEHGLAPDEDVRRWQDRLNPLWRRIGGGCNLNRPIDSLIRGAGFALPAVETMYVPGPRPMTYTYWGAATPA